MKTVLSALICSFFLLQLFGFNWSNTCEDQNENTSNQKKENVQHLIAQQFASNKSTLLLNEETKLNLLRSKSNANGSKTFKYKQFYKGVAIEGTDYIIRAKNNSVENMLGKLMKPINLDVNPSISSDEAIDLVIKKMNHKIYAWQNIQHQQLIKRVRNDSSATFYPEAKLVIVDSTFQNKSKNLSLAYKMDIYSIEPLSRQIIYVDAHDGHILKSIEKIHSCSPETITCTSNYSGLVEIDVCYENTELILKNEVNGGMQVFNANNTKEHPNKIITDEGVNFQNDPTAIDVHFATQKVDDYFRSTHNHLGIDNTNNMPYLSWVHFGENFNHAFWNGNWMTYGDGDNLTYKSLTSIDMVAHEIAHGIIDFSSELIYLNEAGALNESFADFFGEVIEAWTYNSNDWILGADLVLQEGKSGIRNLSNPNDITMMERQPDTYKGNFWHEGYSDHGGVHINSGVHNYMLYLLTEGGSGTNDNGYDYDLTGLGMNIVAEMAYECMTTLPSNASFYDARNNFMQIATNLYGENSNELTQVKEAYNAVGIYDCKERDKAALIALYNALDGPNWVNTWDLNGDYTQWYGVKVNEFGCVTCLDMDGIENFEVDTINIIVNANGCSGGLPAEIGWLSSLDSLILSRNNITGSIPPEFGNLLSLEHMWLDNNSISGSLPAEIGKLKKLRTIFMPNNNLSGSIPPEIGELSNLWYLFLDSNNIEGQLPQEMENLQNLRKMYIEYNNLGGEIPDIFSNYKKMTELSLAGNQLTGRIPKQISKMSNLQVLFLRENLLSDTIPYELGLMNNLYKLHLNDNQLEGTIPSSFGTAKVLAEVYFHNNLLSGCFHSSLLPLCDISGSIFSGNSYEFTRADFCNGNANVIYCGLDTEQIKSNLVMFWEATEGQNWTIHWDFDLPYSDWYGIQTDTEGNVIGIDLDGNDDGMYSPNGGGNNLTGFIPDEIGNLPYLKKIYLSGNNLTKNIPNAINHLEDLESLVLSDNFLTGDIPYEFSALTNLNELRLGNNNLGGCFYKSLDTLCELVDVISIDENNNFDALWDDFCNNNLGYCGGNFVLPGDFNADGKITMVDLLFWGNAFGRKGTARNDATILFIPQYADSWESAADGINDKHKDADGNGVINNNDIQVFKDYINHVDNPKPTNEDTSISDSQVSISLIPVDTLYEFDKVKVVFEIKLHNTKSLHETSFNGSGYSCSIKFGDIKVYEAMLQVDENSNPDLKYFENLDTIKNNFDFVITQTSSNNTPFNQNNLKIIVLIEDLIGSFFMKDIFESYVSVVNNGIDGTINQVIPAGLSSSLHINKENLKADVSIIHKQNTNHGRASIKVSGGNPPYTFDGVGLSFKEIKNDNIIIDSLNEGRYIINISDANNNKATVPIYVDGPNGVCYEGIKLNSPVQSTELCAKIMWNNTDALLQYKSVDSQNWITHLDFDGETILMDLIQDTQYEIRSKYPCVYGDIYSDILIITCPENCYEDTTPPVVVCPPNNQKICAPIVVPPPKTLPDFNATDDCTLTESLSFNVELETIYLENFTTYIYTYYIEDQAENSTVCQEQYHILNDFLQAPAAVNPAPICQDDLWSNIKVGNNKYRIYSDKNGIVGDLLSICDNPSLACSVADFGVDTALPGTYHFWITKCVTFPDNSICESEATPFSLTIQAKPTATLTEVTKTVQTGEYVKLMDFVEGNINGYWTGQNVLSVLNTDGNIMYYFNSNTSGIFKLYYNVKNANCMQSYILIVTVSSSNKPDTPCNNNDFIIYPNPAKDKIFIKNCMNTDPIKISLFNIEGHLIKQVNATVNNEAPLNLSDLKKGIYMVEIENGQTRLTQKLLIE